MFTATQIGRRIRKRMGWLFFLFLMANIIVFYLTINIWFPVPDNGSQEESLLAIFAILCSLPFILLEFPSFLILGIFLGPIAHAVPDVVRIPTFLVGTALINAVLYGYFSLKIGKLSERLWFATLPEDMREVEREMLSGKGGEKVADSGGKEDPPS